MAVLRTECNIEADARIVGVIGAQVTAVSTVTQLLNTSLRRGRLSYKVRPVYGAFGGWMPGFSTGEHFVVAAVSFASKSNAPASTHETAVIGVGEGGET